MTFLTTNPKKPEEPTANRIDTASASQLAWWKFRRHRLAYWSMIVVGFLYLITIFAEFVAPYDQTEFHRSYSYTPPQQVHIFTEDWRPALPFVYRLVGKRDPVTLAMRFSEDTSMRYTIRLFAKSEPYKLFGLIPSSRKLFGLGEVALGDRNAQLFLLGTDRLGRDMLSRVIHGARVSLSIGLFGVVASFAIGIFLGGLSGYFGGWVDTLVQRTIDFLQSLPTIPLWMGLAAAIPPDISPVMSYLLITLILSVIGWTGIARVVRGRFLTLREEDFVMAARFSGASEIRIVLRHITPSLASHIIAALTLAIPEMILAETALSFLGLGLQPPIVSWGVLMKDAQNLFAISQAPWLLAPAIMVVITVLAFNYFGDGLRDAADPYGDVL